METIPNVYDGPRAPAKIITIPSFSLDFANSNDGIEIDSGIRVAIKGVRFSILAIGIGLAKLKARGLYVDVDRKYHSMNDYLVGLCDDMQIDRSTAHNWLWIGEAWLKYRKELEKIEFTDSDGPTKLPYVDKALEIHERKDVFRKVKDLSLRAFKEYSRKKITTSPVSKIKVVDNKIYVGRKLVVSFAKELDPKTMAYFVDINVQAGEALEAGEVLYTTRLYDIDELRRFERRADRLKKEIRIDNKQKIN